MSKYTSVIVKDRYEANIDHKVELAIEDMEKKGYKFLDIHTSRVLNENFKFDCWKTQIVFKGIH